SSIEQSVDNEPHRERTGATLERRGLPPRSVWSRPSLVGTGLTASSFARSGAMSPGESSQPGGTLLQQLEARSPNLRELRVRKRLRGLQECSEDHATAGHLRPHGSPGDADQPA